MRIRCIWYELNIGQNSFDVEVKVEKKIRLLINLEIDF